eukprot:2651997-Amphidinium_carterae.1
MSNIPVVKVTSSYQDRVLVDMTTKFCPGMLVPHLWVAEELSLANTCVEQHVAPGLFNTSI